MMHVGDKPLISLIIPVRLSKDSLYDEVARIRRIVRTIPSLYDVVIVDYGSAAKRALELQEVAAEFNRVKVVRVDCEGETFSVGAARDIGAQHATAPLVMFHDIDFYISQPGYMRILLEARLRGMPENAYSFFALPGTYLTESFTKTYLELHDAGDGEFADVLLHNAVMSNDRAAFENHTYAISAIVVNRHHLLSIGGHDKSFVGHGAEDYELMHRLCWYYPKGPRPSNYYSNTKSNQIQKYEGFRSYFALYGIDVFQRGLVLAHLWHPRRSDPGYTGTGNQDRVSEVMRGFDQGQSQPEPLQDLSVSTRTLALLSPGSSVARSLRHVMPALGRFSVLPEDVFENGTALIDFVHAEGFDQVLFLNPYGNDHRLGLYQAVNQAGIQTLAYDRGALPDSWFFDRRGFLGSSGSYAKELWDHELSAEDRLAAEQYIGHLRRSDVTLEKNGVRLGKVGAREALKIGDRRVIFVALQRPLDTATRYFSGPCQNAYVFNEWISELANKIDKRRYVVVIKKHPLEVVRPNIEGAIFVPDDFHVYDLLEIADKVVVINSGVGLLASAFGKPAICCGRAFYCHEGLAHQASSPEELLALAERDLTVDVEKTCRFYSYLINEFYSFGTTEYIDKPASDGSKLRIASRTMFRVIRGVSPSPVQLGEKPNGFSTDSPLFYSFGGRDAVVAKKPSATAPTKPSAAQPKPTSPAAKAAGSPSVELTNEEIKRRALYRTFTLVASPFQSTRLNKKLRERPREFFVDAKSPVAKFVGRRLLKSAV